MPVAVTSNKWNHLVVSLSLPQNLVRPHTAMVGYSTSGKEKNNNYTAVELIEIIQIYIGQLSIHAQNAGKDLQRSNCDCIYLL